MKYLSCETSKKVKEFLGDSAPEPLSDAWWTTNGTLMKKTCRDDIPAYTLEDILSQPFCKAVANKLVFEGNVKKSILIMVENFALMYFCNGFPAVEAEIERLLQAAR